MPDAVAIGDAADSAWEPLKETVRTLYLVKDRSLEEVMREMASKHSLAAT